MSSNWGIFVTSFSDNDSIIHSMHQCLHKNYYIILTHKVLGDLLML